MSYYNYASLFPAGQAQDRVRGSKVPSTPIELNTLEEAFRYDAVTKTCLKSEIANLLLQLGKLHYTIIPREETR